MGNQIGQLAKVTPLLPVNSATRTSSWLYRLHAKLTRLLGPRAASRFCAHRLSRQPLSRRVLATCEVLRGLAYPAARPRMLSELAPVMTTILCLIPCITAVFLCSSYARPVPGKIIFGTQLVRNSQPSTLDSFGTTIAS